MIPDPVARPTLSVEEAGALLGLGRSAAYAAVARGEIPAIHIGRRIIIPCAGLRRLLLIDQPASAPAAPPAALHAVPGP